MWHFNLHAVNFHTFGHLLPPVILKNILVYVCHETFMGCLSQKYLLYTMLIALHVIFLSILCPNVNIWYASIIFVLPHNCINKIDTWRNTQQTHSFVSSRDEWHTQWYNCWYHSNQYTRTINNSSFSFYVFENLKIVLLLTLSNKNVDFYFLFFWRFSSSKTLV